MDKLNGVGDIDNKNNIILFDNTTKHIDIKLNLYKSIIQRSFIATISYKKLNIISANDLKIAHACLHNTFADISKLQINLFNIGIDQAIDQLQDITDDLSSVIKNYGTQNIEDMLCICFGKNYVENLLKEEDEITENKFNMMSLYCHPINYKIISWPNDSKHGDGIKKKNRIIEDIDYAINATTLEGFDLTRTMDNFHVKVYGGKFIFKNIDEKKTLIINTIIDDIPLECCDSIFLNNTFDELKNLENEEIIKDKKAFENFYKSISIKEYLIYSPIELQEKFINYINQLKTIKQKPLIQLTREFLNEDLYNQRKTIIILLLKSHEAEYQYLAYLLYDLLTNDSNDNIDTQDQINLFDSFTNSIKLFFRDAMKQTINYTNNLAVFDSSQIPLEQQICLLKANENVKMKAMAKLKEVKAKTEDSGAKARQYLESLLKIPFGIYRNEPILNIMSNAVYEFSKLISSINNSCVSITSIPIKEKYTSVEARKYAQIIKTQYLAQIQNHISSHIKSLLTDDKRTELKKNIININSFIKIHNLDYPKILQSGKKMSCMKEYIETFIDYLSKHTNLLCNLVKHCGKSKAECDILPNIESSLSLIDEDIDHINNYMVDVRKTLDKSVYGHEKAKRQVERIIGQWINGENGGYCFGFEGPPGVGKTSLAKYGISQCLKDNNDDHRPFAFIAIGGSSNSSTLDGHNYTYVGSTWGRIVDILMETKCMNPIIFIDELDKISQTENGKEIIGILTHLIDSSQNDTFQDKYFSGIDLDLSKALFIFSYNDSSIIDRILLDRIHRVKFDYLTLKDKLVIAKTYLLPEIYSKMGLEDNVIIEDNIIEFIILEYTCEPGVRKLKEVLFEIVGELNLSLLKIQVECELPINVTKDDIKDKYYKGKHSITEKKIHEEPSVGVISGLWANSMGQGGILPIECWWFASSNNLELKLTGMQGDVMKESMNVAKTLATNLAQEYENGKHIKSIFNKKKDDYKLTGLHIHVPEGSTPKDGPSAGAAITSTLYSRITNRKIRNDVAITGEICLQGKITAIGGLDLKIMGAIRAGVKIILYPKENNKDFVEIQEKNLDNESFNNIEYHEVSNINQVFDIIFID